MRSIIGRAFAGASLFVMLAPVLAAADTPNPNLCAVPDILTVTPDATARVRMNIVGQQGPIADAVVEITFTAQADGLIAWGSSQAHPVVTSVTDANGVADFYLAGGGCATALEPGAFIAEVRADGVIVDKPTVVNSPDAVNSAGELPAESGVAPCEGGMTHVGLSDASFHTMSIFTAAVEPCSKYFGNPLDTVGLADAVFVTPYITEGVSGPCS